MNSKKCLASLIDALGEHVNIRETIEQDADWVEAVDHLDALLR